ncbi:DNA-binding CsgD family transcriptional regulator [Kitasatospora sp. MAP12-15]|uniref:helix-turn-helix transcriptional regulator n=1 Tax=unclassified Kitasatospora TaxID=2633591 RepID=UPI002474DAA5|nr:LuxR family transcriptional regulator [Kitasatospora sp. MAP12-44]MDH6115319.1 DNA-binding CsgD family transcriptional regulator [Kitasatospora sp. MAP12-44]
MRTKSPVTVGRESELSLLRGTLKELHQGCGRAVLLSGEAGIGKSRLADECADEAALLGVPLLRGRGSPSAAGTPFRPLIEALNSRFRRTGPPQDAELGPYRSALARAVPQWRTATAPGHPESVIEFAEALLRLLTVLGRDTGCVLALEDLHDADVETVAVVEYLVDNLAGLPVLLLATLRPAAGAAFDLLQAVERRRAAAVLTLGPLGVQDVQTLAAGCLGALAEEVPAEVADRLAEIGGGNPYLVEELLAEMVATGSLRRRGELWQVAGDLTAAVPASVVRAYGRRAEALGPKTREFLVVAALLGPRISVGTVQLVTGSDERSLFAELRAAEEAELIVPDSTTVDGYAFRHALIGEALLAGVSRAERAVIARRAATALQQAGPELGDGRHHLAATLLETAGDEAGAARLYAKAGRQALTGGTSGQAIRLLEYGHRLAAAADRTDITESLLYALAEAGQVDRALELLDTLPTVGAAAPSIDRRIALHTRLAWAALVIERSTESSDQLAAAKHLLGDRGAPAQTAALAVVQGHLALLPGHDDRQADAERQAREAAEVAQRHGLPVLACQAWQLLAMLARERGFEEADGYLQRMLAVADAHALPSWRFEALIRLGANAFMRTGEARLLEQALLAADELGSITLTQRTEGLLAMYAALTCDPARAREIIGRCLDATVRMRNLATHRYLLLTAATLAAHQGRRREMEHELLAFERAGGGRSFLVPVMLGLCRAVCALLEEDRALAEAELAAAADWERDHPNLFYLAGRYGLRPLLDVLAGRAGRAEHATAAQAPAAELAWNRQFLLVAEAVLLGREGKADQATLTVEAMWSSAGTFPTGSHLALRLAAEAALNDGWGDPVAWLRVTGDYFDALGVAPVAAACRALLRRTGATVVQRRGGYGQIPVELRALGMTTREYEVFALLADRLGNRDIGLRLSISPRTVEKHLASLQRKTGRSDRAALHALSVELAGH